MKTQGGMIFSMIRGRRVMVYFGYYQALPGTADSPAEPATCEVYKCMIEGPNGSIRPYQPDDDETAMLEDQIMEYIQAKSELEDFNGRP